MSILTLIILLLMFITPIISVMTILLRFAEKRQAVTWPQTSGQVTDVRLLQSGREYQPLLEVSYTVDGQSYSSRQHPVSKTGQAKGSKQWARELSLQYKPGTAVAIYYDPNRPKRATLHPQKMQASDSRLQLTSAAMLLLSIGIHLLGARGLIANFLALSGSTVFIAMLISTVVTVLLGVGLGLLIQETRQAKR